MWFIGVEVERETSAPPPKKNPGSAPGGGLNIKSTSCFFYIFCCMNGSMYVSTEHIVSFLPWTQYETLQHMVCNQERMSLLLL